ncbi:31433_t:CDS:2, partial [Gigaspora margarita]
MSSKKLPSDSDSNSLENELEQQELKKEQITSTIQAKSHEKKASTYSKRQKCNIENSESETEASTSVVTTKSAKSSVMQHKLLGRKKAACREYQVIKNEKKCGHIIDTEGSTSNMKHHLLNVYGLTNSGPISHYSNQMRIDDSFQIVSCNNTKRIASINKALTKFIILDNQPLSIIYSESFIDFVKSLDPYYELPSDLKLKEYIYQAFNWMQDYI